MPLPSDQQLNQEKSFFIEKQASIAKLIDRAFKKMKKNVAIPEKKRLEFKTATDQIKKRFLLLKKSTPPKNWQERQNLNNLIEGLNSEIAHLQTIGFSKTPSTTLHLNFLTRLTPWYVKHHKDSLKRVTAFYINARGTIPESDLNNKLFSLPDNIDMLTSLETLYARYNSLSSVPDGLYRLGKLKQLGLEGNGLKSLSPQIKQLKSLEELGLDGNKLSELPKEIGELSKLKILGLNGNSLLSLPDVIGRLTELMSLSLKSNYLFDLPDLSELVHLQTLGLKNNILTQYPRLAPQSHASVDIAKNAIKTVPKPVGLKKQAVR